MASARPGSEGYRVRRARAALAPHESRVSDAQRRPWRAGSSRSDEPHQVTSRGESWRQWGCDDGWSGKRGDERIQTESLAPVLSIRRAVTAAGVVGGYSHARAFLVARRDHGGICVLRCRAGTHRDETQKGGGQNEAGHPGDREAGKQHSGSKLPRVPRAFRRNTFSG